MSLKIKFALGFGLIAVVIGSISSFLMFLSVNRESDSFGGWSTLERQVFDTASSTIYSELGSGSRELVATSSRRAYLEICLGESDNGSNTGVLLGFDGKAATATAVSTDKDEGYYLINDEEHSCAIFSRAQGNPYTGAVSGAKYENSTGTEGTTTVSVLEFRY